MNPFERLRKTIESVNINYQFPENQPQLEPKTRTNNEGYSQSLQKTMTVSNNDELQRIKQICQAQQLASITQITDLTAKLQQLQKNSKRSQTVIENQMREIVELEKENQQLKINLTQQYNTVVQYDEKERKYKEEIYRINVTINELAAEIQAQRNAKKQLAKEVQTLTASVKIKNKQFQTFKEAAQKEKIKITSELEERIQMFEYNIKKCSEDRKQFKLALSAAQQNYSKTINDCKQEINTLKHRLLETQQKLQVQLIRKQNVQQALEREKAGASSLKDSNLKLSEQLKQLKQNYEHCQKSNEELSKNLSFLGCQLENEKKNVKVKVVEVKDESVNLELEMYKEHCKKLMQQKILARNHISLPAETSSFEPQYKILNSLEPNSI